MSETTTTRPASDDPLAVQDGLTLRPGDQGYTCLGQMGRTCGTIHPTYRECLEHVHEHHAGVCRQALETCSPICLDHGAREVAVVGQDGSLRCRRPY